MTYKLYIKYNNSSSLTSNYDKAGVLLYSINNNNEKMYLLGKSKRSSIWNFIEGVKNPEDGLNPILTTSRNFTIGTNNYGNSWNNPSLKIKMPLYHTLSINPPIGIVRPVSPVGMVRSVSPVGMVRSVSPVGMVRPISPVLGTSPIMSPISPIASPISPIIKKPSSWANYRQTDTYQWIYSGLQNNSKKIQTEFNGQKLIYYHYNKLNFDYDLPNRFKRSLNSLSARMSDYNKLAWVKESDLKTLTNCDRINRLPSLNNDVIDNQVCHLIKLI